MNTRNLWIAGSAVLAVACVDHRPIRNGLSSEAVYLDKVGLTAPDTRYTAADDDNWLYRVAVVGASSPNVVGEYAFPGLEGDASLVKFRFRDNALQIVSSLRLQEDRPDDQRDNLTDTDPDVLLEFAGQHVDVKLHESLDGERTNLLEENTELPWQERQKFRVDFSSTSLDPITNAAWFYGEFLSWCAHTVAAHYVPDSFTWEKTCDQAEVDAELEGRREAYASVCEDIKGEADCQAAKAAFLRKPMTCSETGSEQVGFEVEVSYVAALTGSCYSFVSLTTGTGTTTVRYRFSFYRPKTGKTTVSEDGASTFTPTFVAEEIGEKDIVNKRYGVFQILSPFRDHDTRLFSAKSLMQRWNPDRTDAVVYYYAPGFPERYKKPFQETIETTTNEILEKQAGAKLRFTFKDFDDGGVGRVPGDMRYSFVTWHNDLDNVLSGLLGYGPSTSDPRTGEVLSATLNLYHGGLDNYRYFLQAYLEAKGGLERRKAAEDSDAATEACTVGGTDCANGLGCIVEPGDPCDPNAGGVDCAGTCDLAWEEIECQADSTVRPGDPIRCNAQGEKTKADCEGANASGERDCAQEGTDAEAACVNTPRLASALFEEMRRTMNLPQGAEATGTKDDFVPKATQPEFAENFQRILPELRYAEPSWNPYILFRVGDRQTRMADFLEKSAIDQKFQERLELIGYNGNPFDGLALYTREGIDAQQKFMAEFREWKKIHEELKEDREQLFARNNVHVFEDTDAIQAAGRSARNCKPRGDGKSTWESDLEYSERVVDSMLLKTAIHEFGHTLGLRHNFYGSADPVYMRPEEISASVMDYSSLPGDEAGSPLAWGRYDELALSWIYGDAAARKNALKETPLYCTDDHRSRSPLCQAYDIGITPAQIVLNAIEQYDWMYELRNKRAFRKFWNTTGYVGSVYGAVYNIQRMWHLALFDWGGGGVQSILKRLDQVEGAGNVKTSQEYDEISMDFYNDISSAIGMTMAFYDSILNQPASERNYQTEFDPFYGDVIRMGIIIDKLFATFAFMDLQDISAYNPNVATYASMYDAAFGTQNDALAQRVLDDMLGANYDTFPWFKYYALNIFAAVTNSNLIGSIQYRDRIAIQRYNRAADLEELYGEGTIAEATRSDNVAQTFLRGGEEYIYTFLTDRSWHLVASKSKSPVSYQFMKEYNEGLRSDASADSDNYGLKILLAYYEYFNNFVGF